MSTVQDVFKYIDEIAPFHTAMDFDNVGLLVGDPHQVVSRALVALDITQAVLEEAAAFDAQLIVSHHPVIFHSLRRLTSDSIPFQLAKRGVSAIAAHTNLDLADGGVNSCLGEALGLKKLRLLTEYQHSGLAETMVGELENPLEPHDFAAYVKEKLQCEGLFYVEGQEPVRAVGICSGAGGEFIPERSAGIQAFVTGEAKHHELLYAESEGLTLVVAGHYDTEVVVVAPLADQLANHFPDITFRVSQSMKRPEHYL